jgi:aspartate/methionine/tyrosine aminotransferase
MDIVAAAADGSRQPVLHLEVGQPTAPPPRAALEAARGALDGPLGYTDSLGTPELRSAISQHYATRDSVRVPPGRIAVTAGASAGCVLAFLALCDPGDRILVFEPGYPCYRNIAEALGVVVQSVNLGAESGYVPTAGHCEAAVATGGPATAVVVASPSNPTGTALDEASLAALHDWCGANDATLVVDEIYHGTSTATLPSASRFDDAVVLQSFSKYFCMTGWRLGWIVLPEELVRPVEALAQNLYLSPHTVSQAAALAALGDTGELDALARTYLSNREALSSALADAGVTRIAPAHGAFYVWADVGRWGDSTALCRRWLEELAVAATPGSDFDSTEGAAFVRFSVAGSPEQVVEAADRLRSWLLSHPPGQAV